MRPTIKGISFTIDRKESAKIELLPPYANIQHLSHLTKKGRKTVIYYPLKYPPSNWNTWQQLGRIYLLIKRIFPSAEFNNVVRTDGHYEYTVSSFGQYFNESITFPTPYYPQTKNKFMSRLAIYATKLYFDNMLNFELLVAMGLRFNDLLGRPFSEREVFRKANSIIELDKSEWKVRKGMADNSTSTEYRQFVKENRQDRIVELLPSLEKFSKKKVHEFLGSILNVSVKTIRRDIMEIGNVL